MLRWLTITSIQHRITRIRQGKLPMWQDVFARVKTLLRGEEDMSTVSCLSNEGTWPTSPVFPLIEAPSSTRSAFDYARSLRLGEEHTATACLQACWWLGNTSLLRKGFARTNHLRPRWRIGEGHGYGVSNLLPTPNTHNVKSVSLVIAMPMKDPLVQGSFGHLLINQEHM